MKQLHGFSLIEILLSLSLLTSLICSFAYLQGHMRLSAQHCLTMRDTLAAQDKADEMLLTQHLAAG